MKWDGNLSSSGSDPSILFVTATRIGDAVLSTGLLDHFIRENPFAQFTIVAGPVAAPLFLGVPRLQQLIMLNKKSYSRHWLDLYRRIAGRRWDTVIDLRGSALAWLLWTRNRWMIAKGDPNEHRVTQLGRMIGLDPPPSPRLWLRSEDMERARRLIPDGGPVLAIAPAANWRGKQWPPERFAELVIRLTAPGALFRGARVAVFAAPHERGQAAAVLAAIPPQSRLDLLDAGELLTVAAALARTALFVGNDSGLMHMAAAMDVPVLGLFGPSQESHYAPWGRRTKVVRTPLSLEELTSAHGYDHRTTATLMESLSVDAVETAVTELAHDWIAEEKV